MGASFLHGRKSGLGRVYGRVEWGLPGHAGSHDASKDARLGGETQIQTRSNGGGVADPLNPLAPTLAL